MLFLFNKNKVVATFSKEEGERKEKEIEREIERERERLVRKDTRKGKFNFGNA